jgi:hypothetical protein
MNRQSTENDIQWNGSYLRGKRVEQPESSQENHMRAYPSTTNRSVMLNIFVLQYFLLIAEKSISK